MPARHFLFDQSQAGCFHVVNRIYDRKYLLDTEGKDLLLKLVRAYEDVIGVEVLTFCIMDNHFHLLVRVPHRPEGFDVPLEVVVARLERALGETAAASAFCSAFCHTNCENSHANCENKLRTRVGIEGESGERNVCPAVCPTRCQSYGWGIWPGS